MAWNCMASFKLGLHEGSNEGGLPHLVLHCFDGYIIPQNALPSSNCDSHQIIHSCLRS